MTGLGSPLTVYAPIGYCDTKHDHEVRLITDGVRSAYAYSTAQGGTDLAAVLRNTDGTYEATCGQNTGPGEDGEPCIGTVTWPAVSEGDWTTDGYVLRLLADHGTPLEHADPPLSQEALAERPVMLSHAAHYVLLIERADLNESHRIAVRGLWEALTGLTGEDALAYAREVAAQPSLVIAHVTPF